MAAAAALQQQSLGSQQIQNTAGYPYDTSKYGSYMPAIPSYPGMSLYGSPSVAGTDSNKFGTGESSKSTGMSAFESAGSLTNGSSTAGLAHHSHDKYGVSAGLEKSSLLGPSSSAAVSSSLYDKNPSSSSEHKEIEMKSESPAPTAQVSSTYGGGSLPSYYGGPGFGGSAFHPSSGFSPMSSLLQPGQVGGAYSSTANLQYSMEAENRKPLTAIF